jgi:methyltransferase-like protein/2-polyprenyl-3-methyl-5-hydroxy-6-metoxy-1,4-benzoquinol methylase
LTAVTEQAQTNQLEDMQDTTYDKVPYPSFSYRETHPDGLATLATFFGMSPRSVTDCRVLELGCAGGGNLVPIAYSLPGSEIVGIDLSARQIAEGQAFVDALGLKNISLKTMDIMDIGPDFGQFDYIIAHGIYSWVPPAVRDKMFDICRQNMAPNGVAYISYNTFPGWHMIGMLRGMMRYHVRNLPDLAKQPGQAVAFLEFLADVVPDSKEAYRNYIEVYARWLKGMIDDTPPKSDELMLHDELSPINDPVYFHQFISHAGQFELQYLSEAEFQMLPPGDKAPQISAALKEMASDLIEAEQYLDFIQNRTFRRTLLVHEDVALNRAPKPDLLDRFYLTARAKPVSEAPDIQSTKLEQFRSHPTHTEKGVMFSTEHPLVKSALVQLDAVWPEARSLDTLLGEARKRLGRNSKPAQQQQEKQVLAANLLACFGRGLLGLHVHVPGLTTTVSGRPQASPIVRLLSQTRLNHLTNLWHERIEIDQFDQYLLGYLDGEHKIDDLLEVFLAGPIAEGKLVLEEKGKAVEGTVEVRKLLEDELSVHLEWLAKASALIV